jgi:hypothetical protein
MTETSDPDPMAFELTVLGGLGEVLEAALAPCVSSGVQATTVLRLCRDQANLVDTYAQLIHRGFEVTTIVRVA